MKQFKTFRFLKNATFFLIATLFLIGCSKDDSNSDTEETNADPDAIVEYEPDITGIFEGDEGDFPEDIEPEEPFDYSYEDNETNTLSQQAIDGAPEFSMQDFGAAYDEVVAAFPEMDKTSNEFAERIISRIISNGGLTNGTNDGSARGNGNPGEIYDPFSFLNAEEKRLVLRNPIKGSRSLLAAAEAVLTTEIRFGKSDFQTRSDAFRHSYWNWLMTDRCGREWARIFATAHESETPNGDDKRMDLNNNMIGRRVHSNNPSESSLSAQTTLLDFPLLWVNQVHRNVQVGINYLVYMEPMQSITVFDDGPVYDDIYNIILDGNVLGTTPAGGSFAFNFSELVARPYNLDIQCTLDGTNGGCGFQIIFAGAFTLSSGQSQTSQIVIQQSETYSDVVTFPNMNERRTQ